MKYRLIGIANRLVCAGGLLQFMAGVYFSPALGVHPLSLPFLAYFALILGIYVASVYAGLATALMLWRHEADDIDRTARARVESGGTYFLYLRSFAFETEIKLREDNLQAWMRTCWTRGLRSSPRFYIAAAVKSVGPTLGIGGAPGLGMTRYTGNDENWGKDFERLAGGATGIFVLPSMTPGSAAELDWLCSYHLDKTVFLFPPQYAISRAAWDPFWDHYVEFINRYTGFGFTEENVFNRRSGHIFMLHDWRRPLPEGAPKLARAWRFSSIGFRAAAEFLVQQEAEAWRFDDIRPAD